MHVCMHKHTRALGYVNRPTNADTHVETSADINEDIHTHARTCAWARVHARFVCDNNFVSVDTKTMTIFLYRLLYLMSRNKVTMR